MPIEEAAQYEMPFEYVEKMFKPMRQKSNSQLRLKIGGYIGDPRPEMR